MVGIHEIDDVVRAENQTRWYKAAKTVTALTRVFELQEVLNTGTSLLAPGAADAIAAGLSTDPEAVSHLQLNYPYIGYQNGSNISRRRVIALEGVLGAIINGLPQTPDA